jgi:hypothetical protein
MILICTGFSALLASVVLLAAELLTTRQQRLWTRPVNPPRNRRVS